MVRAWAVTLLTDAPSTNAAEVRLRANFPEMAASEPAAPVRLALASGLARLSAAEVWPLAEALALRGEDAQDRYIPGMIWYGLAPHVASNEARALALAARSPLPLLADSVVWYVAREPAGREALTAALPSVATNRRARVLELFAYAVAGRGLVAPPAGWAKAKALLATDVAAVDRLQDLSAAFGDPEALAKLRAVLADRQAPEKQRRAALAFLDKASDAASAPAFAALLDEPAFRKAAIPLVGRFGDTAGIERLLALLPTAKTDDQVLIANTLAGRRATARAWLDAIANGRVPKTTITALQARQIANLGDAELAKRLGDIWGRVSASSEAGRASAARYRKLFDEAPKWSHKVGDGEAVFAKVCAACHAINGKGGNLGPDLGGAARHGAAYFIDNIVEPNAVIGEAFQLNVLTLQDGSVVSGMVTEDADSFTVRMAGGVGQTIRKADVKKREVLEQSMMPPGLLDTLPEKDVVDLLKYLTTDHP
jgi:putative heme-binding domain-containing protein